MGNKKKEERVDDTDVKKLNRLGLGQRAIGRHLGCHEATVGIRLKELGIKLIDTRRNFMEEVYDSLSPEQRQWLADGLYNTQMSVKEFISEMIKEAYRNAPASPAPTPAPLPQMESFSLAPTREVSREALEEMYAHGIGVQKVTTEAVTPVPLKSLFNAG